MDVQSEKASQDDQRVERLLEELSNLKLHYVLRMRELSAMATFRETIARSFLQGNVNSPHEFCGPSCSPSEANASSHGPPRGAEDPNQSKLGRWITRSAGQPPLHGSELESQSKSKLSRWLDRAKQPEDDGPLPSKLSRWISRSSDPKPQSTGAASTSSTRTHDWSEVDAYSGGFLGEVDSLTNRIREAFTAVDAALLLRSREQANVADFDDSADTDVDSQVQTMTGLKCPSCGAELSASTGDGATLSLRENSVGDGARMRGLGLRLEEARKGLLVTHVVPDGLAGSAGVQVNDVIQAVDGRSVRSLRAFGEHLRDGAEAGRLALDLLRGAGAARRPVSLVVLSRDSPPPTDSSLPAPAPEAAGAGGGAVAGAGGGGDADGLLQNFLRARRNERAHEPTRADKAAAASPAGGSGAGGGKRAGMKMNKYGKDTKLWIPESEATLADGPLRPGGGVGGGGGAAAAASAAGIAEIGGFYFFPPGHPDYVPLPPGEAALIAGRQDVHPQERLAPHWSHVVFQSPSGAEIRAQARHATYGSIEPVKGRLVPADPVIAHQELNNAGEVAGCVVYVKRGGAPFTKKARVAVAAGAVACIVANHDRETFGMSYTDDGQPFSALNIPCVMISSDIAEKLEASSEWRVSLTPAKPEHQGHKMPPRAEGETSAADSPAGGGPAAAVSDSPAGPAPASVGLRGLPIKAKGEGLGKPAAKPTMWKKIRLFLP